MTLLRLILLLVIACGLALPACALVGDRPDEVATTLAWLADARRQAARVPADARAPGTVAVAVEGEAPSTTAFQDPFGLPQQDATPADSSEPPRSRPGDVEQTPADAAPDAPPDAPPLPALRMLGSLQQDDVLQALVEIAGTTYRVARGDTLPGGAGKVLAISEEVIEVGDGSTTRTITIAPMPAPAPPARPPRQGKRRLTRPGARA
ncbi:MAG: pilus assembly protein PilP [Herbaspirillum sp.]|nr:pilus assembly protein PilP [Herbaspirillum sp.]